MENDKEELEEEIRKKNEKMRKEIKELEDILFNNEKDKK